MEDFKVLIKVEQYNWHKELILKLLSEKLKTHNVEVRCSPDYFEEMFKNYVKVKKVTYKTMNEYDAVIVDKKEGYIINKAKLFKKQLRIIK